MNKLYTSINEMVFSEHYYNDGEYTSLIRIRNINIETNVKNKQLALIRLKDVLMYYAVSVIDRIDVNHNVVYILPKLKFKENDKNRSLKIKANKDGGGNVGNTLVFIVYDKVLTTMYISNSNDLEEIKAKVNDHAGRTNKPFIDIYRSLIDGHEYTSKIDDELVIDLDLNNIDFFNKFRPFIQLRHNDINKVLTSSEIRNLETNYKFIQDNKVEIVDQFDGERTSIYQKEINIGTPHEKKHVMTEDGVKLVTIIDAFYNKRLYPRPTFRYIYKGKEHMYEPKKGDAFPFQPQVENEESQILRKCFNVPDSDKKPVYIGTINEITYYPIGKGGSKYFKTVIRIQPSNYLGI